MGIINITGPAAYMVNFVAIMTGGGFVQSTQSTQFTNYYIADTDIMIDHTGGIISRIGCMHNNVEILAQ